MKRLLFAIPFVAAAACTYDWTVGPPGTTSGGVSDGGADDAPTLPADGSSSQCEGLRAALGLRRAGIISCSGSCARSVMSECNCRVAVVDDQSSAAQAYVQAAAAVRSTGCAECTGGCGSVLNQCISGVCA